MLVRRKELLSVNHNAMRSCFIVKLVTVRTSSDRRWHRTVTDSHQGNDQEIRFDIRLLQLLKSFQIFLKPK